MRHAVWMWNWCETRRHLDRNCVPRVPHTSFKTPALSINQTFSLALSLLLASGLLSLISLSLLNALPSTWLSFLLQVHTPWLLYKSFAPPWHISLPINDSAVTNSCSRTTVPHSFSIPIIHESSPRKYYTHLQNIVRRLESVRRTVVHGREMSSSYQELVCIRSSSKLDFCPWMFLPFPECSPTFAKHLHAKSICTMHGLPGPNSGLNKTMGLHRSVSARALLRVALLLSFATLVLLWILVAAFLKTNHQL